MSMHQGPNNQPNRSGLKASQLTKELKHYTLLEELEHIIQAPTTKHAPLAAIMALDGVKDPAAVRTLNHVCNTHLSKSLKCQFAELALEGKCLTSGSSLRPHGRQMGVSWSAVPSVEALRERLDWNPGCFGTKESSIVPNQTVQGVANQAWLNSLPKQILLSPAEQRRITQLLKSLEGITIYHPLVVHEPGHPVGGGYSTNFSLAKSAALALGGPLLEETQAELLRYVDFSPCKRHNLPRRSIEEHAEWSKIPEARPSVAWACCHALHKTRMDEMLYSRFLGDLWRAEFQALPDYNSLVVPDEIVAAAFVLNGQLKEAWRPWVS